MAIRVRCETCFKSYSVRDDLIGKAIRCKNCQRPIRIQRERQPKVQADVEDSDGYENVAAEEVDAPISRSLKHTKSDSKKKSQFQFPIWNGLLSIDQFIFLGCVVVLAIQAVLGFGSLNQPDRYLIYYRSILYFAAPSLSALLVLSLQLIAPDENLISQIGKIILALAAGVAAVLITHWLGLSARAGKTIAALITVLVFGGSATANQKKYLENAKRHPVIYAIPVTAVVSIAGFIIHFIHESHEGHNIKAQDALFTVAPFLDDRGR